MTNTNITDHVIDDVWDWLNDATNHGTQPFDYDQVAHAVREALAGYTVTRLPVPDADGDWIVHADSDRPTAVGIVTEDDGAYLVAVAVEGVPHGLKPDRASALGSAILAAVARLASESSGGGEAQPLAQ